MEKKVIIKIGDTVKLITTSKGHRFVHISVNQEGVVRELNRNGTIRAVEFNDWGVFDFGIQGLKAFCEYELLQSKQVTVEVKTPSSKPKLFESKKPKVNVSFKKPISKPRKQKRVVKETRQEFSKKELQSLLNRLRG